MLRNLIHKITSVFFIWVLLNLLTYGKPHEIDAPIGNFIIDVSSSLLVSSSFTGFFCTDSGNFNIVQDINKKFHTCSHLFTENVAKFSRQISKNYVLHKMALAFSDSEFIDQRTPHNHYFVVDFDCEDAVDFLKKVFLINNLSTHHRK